MATLDNPPENRCFGCDPANPIGLHLSFERIEEGGAPKLMGHFTPTEDQTGWPGILHPGLHNFLLMEISYWTALTMMNRVHIYYGPARFEELKGLRVGKEYTLVGRVVSVDHEGVQAEAHSRDRNSDVRGIFQQHFHAVKRSDVKQAGLTLPQYLLDEMDP